MVGTLAHLAWGVTLVAGAFSAGAGAAAGADGRGVGLAAAGVVKVTRTPRRVGATLAAGGEEGVKFQRRGFCE